MSSNKVFFYLYHQERETKSVLIPQEGQRHFGLEEIRTLWLPVCKSRTLSLCCSTVLITALTGDAAITFDNYGVSVEQW